MRIICPNCEAQYEVPDDAISEDGRDVQCSNCGTTWFQHHPDQDGNAHQDVAELPAAEPAPTEPEPEATPPVEEDSIPETPPPAPPRQELDPAVADILRQEGAREAAARAAEADHIEVQQELGLTPVEDDATRRQREARERLAKIRRESEIPAAPDLAQSEPSTVSEEAAVNSRRELLPDIEEINSTLRSTSDRELAGDDYDPDAPVRTRKKRGFRRGFTYAVLLVAIGALIYAFAPQIADQFPQADPWLSGYVTWVDNMREGLDTRMQGVLKWLDELAAASSQN